MNRDGSRSRRSPAKQALKAEDAHTCHSEERASPGLHPNREDGRGATIGGRYLGCRTARPTPEGGSAPGGLAGRSPPRPLSSPDHTACGPPRPPLALANRVWIGPGVDDAFNAPATIGRTHITSLLRTEKHNDHQTRIDHPTDRRALGCVDYLSGTWGPGVRHHPLDRSPHEVKRPLRGRATPGRGPGPLNHYLTRRADIRPCQP